MSMNGTKNNAKEAADAISVRLRTNVDLKSIPLVTFMDQVSQLTRTKSRDLWPGQ